MKGAFLDCDTVSNNDVNLTALIDISDIKWRFYNVTEPGDTDERVRGCDIVISNKAILSAATLASASNTLKLIVVAATGTNNIDLEAARLHNITVCNARGYGTASVVQHVYALILALTTQLPNYMSAVSAGEWNRHPHFCLLNHSIRELDGLTLGIVGHGTLGKGVADAAPAFGLKVIISQRPGGETKPNRYDIDDLLEQSDIVSLHCPLTDHTRNLINRDRLKRMKENAILINTARGGIVNERDLAQALKARDIGGAGIDVLSEEPPRHGNPLLDQDIPNLIVTPHIAWSSRDARQRVVDICANNIKAFLQNKPINVVV